MNIVRCLTRAAVVLACCGILMPRVACAAPVGKPNNDVALTANGALTGVLVTAEGQALDGATVLVRRGGQDVAKTVTNANGAFSFTGLGSGLYELQVGQQATLVRAWTPEVAPPTAKQHAVIVVGDAVRGEYCPPTLGGLDIITLWTLTASTGALILAAINQSDLNDIQDQLDELASP
ncbi:MAG: carboxypeptidase regulatory-like domain-containing protein [Planctomycetaceae bacterium]|nr:carboxypeptidase regulatory-like domain-containing protein [Planctomycetaceae bacterium]